MSLNTVAHLNFRGQAREALEFYQSVFGGQAVISTYGDFGMPAELPGAQNVVFGQLVAENGFRVMAYDVPGEPAPRPQGEPTTRRRTASHSPPSPSSSPCAASPSRRSPGTGSSWPRARR